MSVIEKNIVAQAKRFGEPIPDRISKKPKLWRESLFYMDAFMELDSDRSVGMTAGPIPWSSMNAYADAYDIHGDARHEFIYLVRQLDNAYLKRVAEKANG